MKITRKQLRKLIKEMMNLKPQEDDIFIASGPSAQYPGQRRPKKQHTLYADAGYFRPADPYKKLHLSVRDVFTEEELASDEESARQAKELSDMMAIPKPSYDIVPHGYKFKPEPDFPKELKRYNNPEGPHYESILPALLKEYEKSLYDFAWKQIFIDPRNTLQKNPNPNPNAFRNVRRARLALLRAYRAIGEDKRKELLDAMTKLKGDAPIKAKKAFDEYMEGK